MGKGRNQQASDWAGCEGSKASPQAANRKPTVVCQMKLQYPGIDENKREQARMSYISNDLANMPGRSMRN